MPSRSRTPRVWPYSRAVTRTPCPRSCSRSTMGRSTSGCAAAVQSTQTFTPRWLRTCRSGRGGERFCTLGGQVEPDRVRGRRDRYRLSVQLDSHLAVAEGELQFAILERPSHVTRGQG